MPPPRKVEFGDFQTPPELAREVCQHLARGGLQPASLVEPTCGLGAFLFAGLDAFPEMVQALGADLNREHVREARKTLRQRPDTAKATIRLLDFFSADWPRLLATLPEPILVLGNPPWVTNAVLGGLGSSNLPTKSNYLQLPGLAARTGKANFDISEWMLTRLVETLSGRRGTLAMLCKTSVARKVLAHAWKQEWSISKAAIHPINALRSFSVAVDAALLVAHFEPDARCAEATIEPFGSDSPSSSPGPSVLGYEDGLLLANVTAYRRWQHLAAQAPWGWRSGIKHDCARVMELHQDERGLCNSLGERVDLEPDLLFPLLKSSDLATGRERESRRWLLVPQLSIGDETSSLEQRLPRTWRYLMDHAAALDRRASSIYRGRPRFSVFGVGDYSFSPWKVAISGFYKRLDFQLIGPREGKPVVFDDTAYFFPCSNGEQAEYLAELLASPPAQEFLRSFIFWDAKRPITAELLRRLDLRRLAEELGTSARFESAFGTGKPTRK